LGWALFGYLEIIMSKQIQLTKGYVVTVDDEDYGWLIRHSWHVHDSNSQTRYAVARIKGKMMRMHRVILFHHGLLEDGLLVDHMDGNGLNNQKNNLRACTHAENQWNRIGPFRNGYLGVFRSGRKKNPWGAQIMVNYKQIFLGNFPTKEKAAIAYDNGARKYHGKFATLNFPLLSGEKC
jgi:hypothetical protein